MKKVLAIILILSTLTISSQEKVPEPYMPEEFPQVMHDVRRGSIIFCGAFPLGFMYSSLLTETSLSNSSFYTDKTEQEQVKFKLSIALAFATFVMLIDFVIEKIIRGSN